jgi:hypothetical protein
MGEPEVFRRSDSGHYRKVGYLRDWPPGVIGEHREYLGPCLAEDVIQPAQGVNHESAE